MKKIILSIFVTMSCFAASASLPSATDEAQLHPSKYELALQLINSGNQQGMNALAQNLSTNEAQQVSENIQTAGVSYCGGAFWCVFIVERMTCEYQASCQWHW